MPMQALPVAPVDLPAATPSAPPAPNKGEDGLFAARLQAATNRQQTTTSPTATERTDSVTGSTQIVPESAPDQHETTATEAPPATSLNGSAGAALQAVPVGSQANSATIPPAGAPGGETAITRMLDVLSKGGNPAMPAAAIPDNAAIVTMPAAEPVVAGMQAAHSSSPVQATGIVSPQQPFTTIVPETDLTVQNHTGSAAPPEKPSRDNIVGRPAVGGSAIFSVAPQDNERGGNTLFSVAPQDNDLGGNTLFSVVPRDNDPLPRTNPTPAASSLLAGSALLGEGKGGPPQAETPSNERAQTPDRAPSGIQATVPIAEQAAVPAAPNATQADNPFYVQNKYGQIITIQQSTGAVEEGEAESPAAPVATGSGQRLDANSNYIHTRLPKEPPDQGTEQNSGQSAVATPKPQQGAIAASESGQPNQAFAEQTAQHNNQAASMQDAQPLVFAQPPTSSLTAAATPGQSTVYHLASGLMVPEGTVVDQMIAHFATNRRLDTGEVTLRLHPQELGEVRMAIKVEQDNVKAHIIAQNPQAQEMIDRHLPRLREALEQQGLNLHQVEVTVAAHDNAGGERFQDNNAWRQPTASSHRSEQPLFSLESDEITAADTVAANNTLSVLA